MRLLDISFVTDLKIVVGLSNILKIIVGYVSRFMILLPSTLVSM